MNPKDVEFIKGLDDIYNFYIENKFEDVIKYDDKKIPIDHILIATWIALHEAPLPQLNKNFIAKSKIEGLGAFAKRNIKKGEIVSMYPSEIVQLHCSGKSYPTCSDRVMEKYNLSDENNMDEYINNNRNIYKMNENYSIAGDHFISDTNFTGHLLNDACDGTKENDDMYNIMSFRHQNCIYYPYKIFILIVACKNINKNEELLVSYQTDYWKAIKNY